VHILELTRDERNPWTPAKYQHLSSVRLVDHLKCLLVATNHIATADTYLGRPPQCGIFSQQTGDLRVQSDLCRGPTEVSFVVHSSKVVNLIIHKVLPSLPLR
jgi:hypothetical protein